MVICVLAFCLRGFENIYLYGNCYLSFQVEWKFVFAVFISKAIVFVVAFVFTLFLKRPLNIGLAAIAGIFVTQSNDFALGYPIGRHMCLF